jgi:hypothetical protein
MGSQCNAVNGFSLLLLLLLLLSLLLTSTVRLPFATKTGTVVKAGNKWKGPLPVTLLGAK